MSIKHGMAYCIGITLGLAIFEANPLYFLGSIFFGLAYFFAEYIFTD